MGGAFKRSPFPLRYRERMNERRALAVIETNHGSLEEFFVGVLDENPDVLNDELPIAQRAALANLPLPVFARVIKSQEFRSLVRSHLVNEEFSIFAERDHYRHMAGVAKGNRRLVATSKGDLVYIDQAPTDMIAAGRYLNEARGTPVEQKNAGGTGGVVINIGGATVNIGGQDGSEDAVDVEFAPHQPRRAGDLPPSGVQSRGAHAAGKLLGSEPVNDAAMGALYGPKAEEQDEDDLLRAKTEGSPERPDEGVKHAKPQRGPNPVQSFAERARLWANLPNRKPSGDGGAP